MNAAKPLAGSESSRTGAHSRRTLGGPDARRSRRRGDQGRAPGRRRRHARLGPAVHRRARTASGSTPPISMPAIAANARWRSISNARKGARSCAVSPQSADVLIENFKTGGLAKYGLDYASLKAINPRLVYCSITGFGHDGPYAAARRLRLHRPGHGRGDGADGRARRRAAEDRRRLRRHLHRPLRGRRHPSGADPPLDHRLGRRNRHGAARHAGERARQSGAELPRLGPIAAPHGQRPSQHRALSGVRGRRRAAHRRRRQRSANARLLPHPRPRGPRRRSALCDQRRPRAQPRELRRRASRRR